MIWTPCSHSAPAWPCWPTRSSSSAARRARSRISSTRSSRISSWANAASAPWPPHRSRPRCRPLRPHQTRNTTDGKQIPCPRRRLVRAAGRRHAGGPEPLAHARQRLLRGVRTLHPGRRERPAAPGQCALQGRGRRQSHAHRLSSPAQRQCADPHCRQRTGAHQPHHLCRARLSGRDGSGPCTARRCRHTLPPPPPPSPALPPGPGGLPRLPLKPSPFGRLAEQAPTILAQADEATRRINQLLGDGNQQLLTEALGHISQVASHIDTLTRRLDTSVAQRLDAALAALPPLADDARKTLQSLQQASASVSALASDIGRTSQRLNAEDGAIDQISHGTRALTHAAEQFGSTTL